MAGVTIEAPVLIYDDDGGYLASALAEQLLETAGTVRIVTPHATFARWTHLTLEQQALTRRVLEKGIALEVATSLVGFEQDVVQGVCTYTGRPKSFEAASLVVVTSRAPQDTLYQALVEAPQALAAAGIEQVHRIGDCEAPGLIAHAVFSGHRFARQLGKSPEHDVAYRRELPLEQPRAG